MTALTYSASLPETLQDLHSGSWEPEPGSFALLLSLQLEDHSTGEQRRLIRRFIQRHRWSLWWVDVLSTPPSQLDPLDRIWAEATWAEFLQDMS